MQFIASDTVCNPRNAQSSSTFYGAGADARFLDGLEVRLPSNCGKCGCVTASLGTEAARSSVRCASCRAHLGWVSQTAERFLRKVVERFGRPTKPIEIHHSRNAELSPSSPGAAADGSNDTIAPEKLGK
jgi:hypothetical protein